MQMARSHQKERANVIFVSAEKLFSLSTCFEKLVLEPLHFVTDQGAPAPLTVI
jgi:hypothetical protein